MDPITAFQVAASVITFVDFGVKLIHVVREVCDSAEGVSEENRLRAAVNRSMRPILDAISTSEYAKIPEDEKPLYILALECQKCHKEMDELLGHLPAKGHSRLDKLFSSFKAVRNEPELKRLEARLGKCLLQISAHQIHIQGKRLAEFYQVLQTQGNNGFQMVESMQKHVDSLRADIVQIQSKTAQDHISLVLACHKKALAPIFASRIQKSLGFQEIAERYNNVDAPKESTFSWILNDTHSPANSRYTSSDDDTVLLEGSEDSYLDDDIDFIVRRSQLLNSEEQNKRAQMRDKFITWLGSSDGIFHLTGVPGAGKSTIMKFIHDNPATKKELQKWAGGRTLCLAKHFFWRPGSALQHNLNGLLCSLLHDIFKTYPKLIANAMPVYWKKAQQIPILSDAKIEIPPAMVEQTFLGLIQDEGINKDYCFCFFIDGLDEFIGSDQQDFTSLADLLTSWVRRSNGNLKICVSSREENAFMNAFQPDKRLQLHQLTWNDISIYVREGLQKLEPGDSKEKLIYKVCKRARGIFVWVILVVRHIREKIESGKTNPKEIEASLSIPEGLENLVVHTLRRLNSDKRKKLCQVTAMLGLYAHDEPTWFFSNVRLTQHAFLFLDDYNSDHEFATRDIFEENCTDVDKSLLHSEKSLRYCSGGFLKISEQEWTGGKRGKIIVFIHRSIPELLDREECKHLLGYVDKTEAARTLSHLLFAQVRAGTYDSEESADILSSIMMLCLQALDESIYDFLACVHSWYKEKFSLRVPVTHKAFIPMGPRMRALCSGSGYIPPTSTPIDDKENSTLNALNYAVINQKIEFAKFIIERDPGYLNEPWTIAQVAELLLLPFWKKRMNLSAWNRLLDGELLKENEDRRFNITNLHVSLRTGNILQQSTCNISIWQWYLTIEFFKYITKEHAPWGLANSFERVEWFLSHGASANFMAKIFSEDVSDGTVKFCVCFEDKDLSFLVPHDIFNKWVNWKPRLFEFQTISLRYFVTHAAPENMEKLLLLIDASAESGEYHRSDIQPRNAQIQNGAVPAMSGELGLGSRPEDSLSGGKQVWDIKERNLAAYVDFTAAIILGTLSTSLNIKDHSN
ncbi:unnamed protein product [Clonostachys rosea]|uniref:Nephrocystin 3-like N-terminal domain-containing protein n=1 Tax=Bionectria ochroleuca TaxID=29856 RepID=A0ABY6UBZ9_BIOOC|nr:unnamed protein product [Clonostachys rosea]